MNKYFALTLLGLIGMYGIFATPIAADSPWSIARSHAELHVEQDGKITVTEKIDVKYDEHEATTITHSIPLKYVYDNETRFVRIDIEKVQRNLVDEPYVIHNHHDYMDVIIGDERLELKGSQSYQITYTMEGVLKGGKDTDRLIWVGAGGWGAPVKQATVSVDMPVEQLDALSCEVRHSDGSVQEDGCKSVGLSQGRGRYVAKTGLQPQGSLIVTANYEKGAVPLSKVQPTRLADWFTVYRRPLFVLLTISAMSLVGAVGLWYLRRKYRSTG